MKIVRAGKKYLVNGAAVSRKALEAIFSEILTVQEFEQILDELDGDGRAIFGFEGEQVDAKTVSELEDIKELTTAAAVTAIRLVGIVKKLNSPTTKLTLHKIVDRS